MREWRNELPAAVGARGRLSGGMVMSANAQHFHGFSERNKLARDGRIARQSFQIIPGW